MALDASLGGQEVPDTETWVPLHYEGGTVIGKARVRGNKVEMELDPQFDINGLIAENLVGMSIMKRFSLPDTEEEKETGEK